MMHHVMTLVAVVAFSIVDHADPATIELLPDSATDTDPLSSTQPIVIPPPETPSWLGSIFSMNCDTCENMSIFTSVYCCEIQSKCCPPDKPGYCPFMENCLKSGFFQMTSWCFFDDHCPQNQKCCGSLFYKCCKPNGQTEPLDIINHPVQTITSLIEEAPNDLANGVANAFNPMTAVKAYNDIPPILNPVKVLMHPVETVENTLGSLLLKGILYRK